MASKSIFIEGVKYTEGQPGCGLKYMPFRDELAHHCSLKESCTAGFIWCGLFTGPMYLSQESAARLIPVLQFFVSTGNLPVDLRELETWCRERELANEVDSYYDQ